MMWVPAPTPAPPPPLVVQPVCIYNMSLSPGAFVPWVVYKYLKVNTGGFLRTAPKDLMGAQTLLLQNANVPMRASWFQCVRENNEWKARVRSSQLAKNILTMT